MKHKFDLGDVVECRFEGEIAGFPAAITKRLWVVGVRLIRGKDIAPGVAVYHTSFLYTLAPINPAQAQNLGKTHDKMESDLVEIEPVVAAIEKAQTETSGESFQDTLSRLDEELSMPVTPGDPRY